MSLSQGLKSSLRGVSNGRQRMFSGNSSLRHYSLNARSTPLSSSGLTRSTRPGNTYLTQQYRSLSLFGWGSKPTSNDLSATSSGTIPATTPQVATTVDPIRTVKASHDTSITPDPSTAHPHLANEHTPEALQRLENAILNPHNAVPPAEQLADIPDLASIPERIGYLKEVCALDFGWGPSSILEFGLEHLHITAGLSWANSIIVLAVLFRLALIRPSYVSSEQNAKMREMAPILTPLQERSKAALAAGDKNGALEVQREISALRKEYGLSFGKIFLPMILQLPFQIAAFRVLSAAGNLPVPAFETEHWLWLSNISTTDPTYALPLIISTLTYFNLARTVKGQPDNKLAGYMKNGLPLMSFAIMIWQPASLHLFFLVNGAFNFVQMSTFQSARFRSWAGLTPLVQPLPASKGPKGPTYGNMKVVNPGQLSSSPDQANRSLIDKGVDTLKQSWKNATVGSSYAQNAKKKQENKTITERQEKWEIQRQDELEASRRERNSKIPR